MGIKLSDLPASVQARYRPARKTRQMNGWEREYQESLKINPDVLWWRYETLRLRLADGAWYKPDFMVAHKDGSIFLIEVKGHQRAAAVVRFKVAAEQYPMFNFRMVGKSGGAFTVLRDVPAKMKWETK
jgi:hypothetical protein